MRRSGAAIIAFLTLAGASPALAAFDLPSALFRAAQRMSAPRSFSYELHAHMGDEVYASAWFTGEISGGPDPRALALWTRGTFDLVSVSDGQKLRVKAGLRLLDRTLYFAVLSAEASDPEALANLGLSEIAGTWSRVEGIIPEDAPATPEAAWEKAARDMREMGIMVTAEELRSFADDLIDALFHMDRTPFEGGNAYTLTLEPRFLQRAAPVLRRLAEKADPSFADLFDPRDQSLREFQEMIRSGLTLTIKVDTDERDEILFQQGSVSFELPEAGGISYEGTARSVSGPLRIDPPAASLPLEEWFAKLPAPAIPLGLPMMLPMGEEFLPGEAVPTFPTTGSVDCDVLRGSATYVDFVRKGLCPYDARPRRGALREE